MIRFKFNIINCYCFIIGNLHRYLYTGIIEIENADGVFILNLLTAADEIILPDFIEEVQKYLIENRSHWIIEQFYTVLDFAFSQVIYKSLQNFCLSLICADPPLLFDSEYFDYTDVNLLTALLQRDDLAMQEIDIWNHLIRWGLSQQQLSSTSTSTSTSSSSSSSPSSFSCSSSTASIIIPHSALSQDPGEWNQELWNKFQKSLSPCIPFVRFSLMTPEQFRERVWPFKQLLNHELYDNVLWHFLMPERQLNLFAPRLKPIDSKLITLKHVAIIATWIDHKEKDGSEQYSYTDIPYDFTLIMRGSRDGFSQQTLHQRCGGVAKTVMLMKIKSTEEIFGMYISSVWSNATSSSRTHDSFMFSFNEGRNSKKPVLSRVRAAGYDLALTRGRERGMDELEMFKVTQKSMFGLS